MNLMQPTSYAATPPSVMGTYNQYVQNSTYPQMTFPGQPPTLHNSIGYAATFAQETYNCLELPPTMPDTPMDYCRIYDNYNTNSNMKLPPQNQIMEPARLRYMESKSSGNFVDIRAMATPAGQKLVI